MKNEIIRVRRLELVDRYGRKRAILGAEQGIPYVAVYDGKGKIRSWLTFTVDGVPDLRFFEEKKGLGNREVPKLKPKYRKRAKK